MRCYWWLVGLRPSLRQSSLPVAGSCAVTMSPPETTISVRLLTFSGTGVVYASGASAMALGRPLLLPDRLSGRLVDAQQVAGIVGLHAVQHLHVQRVAQQQRRAGVSPVEPELPVVLLDVARPALLAVEREALERARPGHHPDRGAIGHRRGRRHVLLAHVVVAAAEQLLPAHGAGIAIERPQIEAAGLGDVQEDVILPDDRRRAAAHRHRRLPGDVLGRRPFRRQAGLLAGAIKLRAAPLRPVVGVYGKPGACRQQQPERNRCSHRLSPPHCVSAVSYNERILCHCPATRSPGRIGSCSTATRKVTTCCCRKCAPTTRRASCGTTWSPPTNTTRRTATSPTATSATSSSRRSPTGLRLWIDLSDHAIGHQHPARPLRAQRAGLHPPHGPSRPARRGLRRAHRLLRHAPGPGRRSHRLGHGVRAVRRQRRLPRTVDSARTTSRPRPAGTLGRRRRARLAAAGLRSQYDQQRRRISSGTRRDPRGHATRTVPRRRARPWALPRPISFIKADIEGAEPLAFRGADALLRADRPVILSELHPLQLDRVSGVTPAQFIAEMHATRLPLPPAGRRCAGRGN